MDRKQFQAFCKGIFKGHGFIAKGSTHFYKDLGKDVLLVIALEHSSYGATYYFRGGIIIKSINQHMPYPKYYDANIRCISIHVEDQYAYEYEAMDESDCDKLRYAINNVVEFYDTCREINDVKENILVPGKYAYCKDYSLRKCFGSVIPEDKLLPEHNQI